MTSKTKKPTIKAKIATSTTKPEKARQPIKGTWEETFDARRLLAIPLLVLAAYTAYFTIMTLSSFSQIFQIPYAVVMFPPFVTLFIAAFCSLASYLLIKGKAVGRFVTVVAWVFVILAAWLALAWLASKFPGNNPRTCEGLFGAQQNCTDVSYFQAFVLLLNPLALTLYSLLSITAIVVLIRRLQK